MSVIDFTLKTDLGFRRYPPLVFTTGISLNERFTRQDSRCVFVVKCNYIPPSEFAGTKERLVFSNRRCIDVNERFTSYRNCEFEKMENNRLENRKRLELELRSMAKKRRTVETSTTPKGKTASKVADGSKKSGKKSFESRLQKKAHSLENSYCSKPVSPSSNNVDKLKITAKHQESASSDSSFFGTPVSSSKCYGKFKSFTRPNFNGTPLNLNYSTPIGSRQYDRFKYVDKKVHDFRFKYGDKNVDDFRFKYVDKTVDDFRFKYVDKNVDDLSSVNGSYDANGYYGVIGRSVLSKRPLDIKNRNVRSNYSEALKFPEKYEYFKNRRLQKAVSSPYHFYAQRESMYRWRREPVSKEQLDDELDRYMSEVKFKLPVAEKDDVDSFVEEYLLETEKYLNTVGSMDFD